MVHHGAPCCNTVCHGIPWSRPWYIVVYTMVRTTAYAMVHTTVYDGGLSQVTAELLVRRGVGRLNLSASRVDVIDGGSGMLLDTSIPL